MAPTLTIALTVAAAGNVPVPVSFGFHPYLRLPGVERDEWEVEIPVGERLLLDSRMLPSGEREPVRIDPGPLAGRTFDDAFDAPPGRKRLRPLRGWAADRAGARRRLSASPRSTRPPTTR